MICLYPLLPSLVLFSSLLRRENERTLLDQSTLQIVLSQDLGYWESFLICECAHAQYMSYHDVD